jgi:hypothetical protein
MKKYILIGVGILILAFVAYKYVYQSHRDISEESASFTVAVPEIHKEFITNDSLAYAKYLDKTIQLQGKISQIDTLGNSLLLDEKLVVLLKDKISDQQKINQNITVKGRFIGYDDLLDELKIDQATIVK